MLLVRIHKILVHLKLQLTNPLPLVNLYYLLTHLKMEPTQQQILSLRLLVYSQKILNLVITVSSIGIPFHLIHGL